MDQKIIIRVSNVPEAKTAEAVEEEWRGWVDDSVVVFITVNETVKNSVSLAVELLQHRSDLDEVKVGLKANFYEDYQLVDDDLFDQLWEDYAGRCVDEFPAVTGDPSTAYAPELVVTRPNDKVTCPDDCCVWIIFRSDPNGYLYSAPVKFLGDMAETLFSQISERA